MTVRTGKSTLPTGYALRAPRIDDAEAVTLLMNLCAQSDTGMDTTTVEMVLSQWDDPQRNLEDEDWIVTAPNGQVVGFLELYEYEPFTTYEFDGYVHPEHQGRGIGSVLLDTIEQRARRGIERAPADEPVVLRTRVWSANQESHALLRSHGFEHVRNWREMRIDFADAPSAPQFPAGIAVRSMQPGQDERAVWQAVEESFADHWGYTAMPFDEFMYYRIDGQPGFDPSLVIIAQDGVDIAGVAICLPSDDSRPESGWVSVLGVRSAWRGRGIGMALLAHAFGEFHLRGYRGVGLNVDGSSLTGADRLYERAGMHEVRRAAYFDTRLR